LKKAQNQSRKSKELNKNLMNKKQNREIDKL